MIFSLSTSAQMRNWRLVATPSITGLAKPIGPFDRVLFAAGRFDRDFHRLADDFFRRGALRRPYRRSP